MTQDEKAARYDELVRRADLANRELSKLKSENISISKQSPQYDIQINELKKSLARYEFELKELFK